jgi:hypothetical protein
MAGHTLLCDRITGSTDNPAAELCGVPRRVGLRRLDGRYPVLCQARATWRIGTLHACDRDLAVIARKAMTGGRTEIILASVGQDVDPQDVTDALDYYGLPTEQAGMIADYLSQRRTSRRS